MRLGYTEFSFAYAFTENLVRSALVKPTGAPTFPNLVQEAQLGYDVKLDRPGDPLFFQYKLPELMTRETAKEISKYSLRGLTVPFFRMPLMRHDLSAQHERLMDLEKKFPNAVFYASPGMDCEKAFNVAYNAAEVHLNSVLFSPAQIGSLADNKPHTIAYRSCLPYAWLCSDPREIPMTNFASLRGGVADRFGAKRYASLRAMADDVLREVSELVSPEVRNSEEQVRQRISGRVVDLPDRGSIDPSTREVAEQILVAREMARIGLGVDMVVAQPRTG